VVEQRLEQVAEGIEGRVFEIIPPTLTLSHKGRGDFQFILQTTFLSLR